MSVRHSFEGPGFSQDLQRGPLIGELLVQALRKFSDRAAFVQDGRALTYKDLYSRVEAAAARLKSLDLKKGQGVVQIASNSPDVFALAAACYICNYKSIVLPPTSSLQDHLYAIQDSQAPLLVVDDAHLDRGQLISNSVTQSLSVLSHGNGDAKTASLRNVPVPPAFALIPAVEAEDVIRQNYTGGTTGVPKGVMTSSRSLTWSALHFMATQNWERKVNYLCCSPMAHAAGTIMLPVILRGGCVFLSSGFNAEEVIRTVVRDGITSMFLVPTMIYALLDQPGIKQADLSSLNRIIYGASPISGSRLKEALDIFGPVFVQIYGQTEAPSSVLTLSADDHLSDDPVRLTSAGTPFPGVNVQLLNDNMETVDRGEIGEICVRGPLVMSGYWNQPELTADALRGSWLHTGDLAYQDDEGYFYIVDRKKDMVISGGINVYPKEIENVLMTHPAVASAAVIGVPDEKWGEAVKAIVVLRSGKQAQADELIQFVKTAKGSILSPKSVELVEALPLTTFGKVDKNALRAPYWAGVTRRVNG